MAEPFDPDAFLSETDNFDPDAFLAGPGVPERPAKPQVGPWETFFSRAAGAIPLGETLTNALVALRERDKGERSRLTPKARAALEAMGEQEVRAPEPMGLVDTYRTVRDTRKERTAAGSEQNPKAGRAGAATGIAASILAPLPKVSVGGGLGGRLASAGLTGAGYGALDRLEHGDADLTRGEVGKAAREAAEGAAVGGATGLAAGGVAEGVARAAPALRRLAVSQAKRVIQGNSDIAAATRQPLSDEAVVEVLHSGAIQPLSTTQKTYQRIAGLAEEEGAKYSRLVSELEARGVEGPDARALADGLLARGAELEPRTLNEAIPEEFLKRAEQIAGKGGPSGRLGLSQAEDLKRSAQEMARYDRLTNTSTEEAKQEVASMLRQSVEDSIEEAAARAGAGSEVERLGRQFVPTKQRLGRLLEARTFAEKGASKAEQRSPISLKDYMLGASAGDPATALGTALLAGVARNRGHSTVASGAYELAGAVGRGTKGVDAARITPALARLLGLDGVPDEETQAALEEALRRRKGN